ncbi:division/cell wall cluster transcriptional repressor MraZ [Mucilaginibacter myungsuensis]|uniref:Transcriptional regulator MraZ n=1 Tax=Mucilaginibacter myungsuensis TaxID=649104 RepID=A0A929KUD4_9SPHI|nr:division/cell wall cluster transcriptional repressor MraZ [Mucilaginibacter myungsuensis]MBE9661734.1 division/cell wall cluster transcriptional repressor MraZ [Mucilaginibacter myungsuensis]MDN3599834.1 division/cell wall cluster transcriptional repressor MraZ [Mucilaginibacter myungsuensis]
MSYLFGEYSCKLDVKSRLTLPSALKQQLPNAGKDPLVIARGFEKYLVIYTKKEWEAKLEELLKLNQYERENLQFIRHFTRGATEIEPDAAGRVLLPKMLTEYAGIDSASANEVIVTSQINRIEIWERAAYDAMMDNMPVDFAALAEKVMGDKGKGANE